MRNRQVYCCIAAVLFPLSIFAQPHAWTLRECEDYAVANNITISSVPRLWRNRSMPSPLLVTRDCRTSVEVLVRISPSGVD